MSDPFVKVEEAAAMISCHVATIRTRCEQHQYWLTPLVADLDQTMDAIEARYNAVEALDAYISTVIASVRQRVPDPSQFAMPTEVWDLLDSLLGGTVRPDEATQLTEQMMHAIRNTLGSNTHVSSGSTGRPDIDARIASYLDDVAGASCREELNQLRGYVTYLPYLMLKLNGIHNVIARMRHDEATRWRYAALWDKEEAVDERAITAYIEEETSDGTYGISYDGVHDNIGSIMKKMEIIRNRKLAEVGMCNLMKTAKKKLRIDPTKNGITVHFPRRLDPRDNDTISIRLHIATTAGDAT